MNRQITRQWKPTYAFVSTRHPQLGDIFRGRICLPNIYDRPPADPQARMTWRLVDHDGMDLGEVTGDYLDAEARLLDATAWADEPIDPAELDELDD